MAISKMFQCENLNFLEECHLGSKELQEISCWGFGGGGGEKGCWDGKAVQFVCHD